MYRGEGHVTQSRWVGTKAEKESARGPAKRTANYSLGCEMGTEWLAEIQVYRVLCARLGEQTLFPGKHRTLKGV